MSHQVFMHFFLYKKSKVYQAVLEYSYVIQLPCKDFFFFFSSAYTNQILLGGLTMYHIFSLIGIPILTVWNVCFHCLRSL